MTKAELKDFLEEKYLQYNTTEFIESDPISIPHRFSKKEDIEIAGFLAATIAWGNRASIIKNANKLMDLLDDTPHEFVLNASFSDLKPFSRFVHRTFNGEDCIFFVTSLMNIYRNKGGLENIFSKGFNQEKENVKDAIINFRKEFFKIKHPARTLKHVSNPEDNSAAKRLNMFLRWMVRNDNKGVDFGLWKEIKPSQLCLPLDVHTGNVSRKLGLLKRNQNDWKAVEEVTNNLKKYNAKDPIKYDFALFGLGVFEKF